jgi:hypothetical protein
MINGSPIATGGRDINPAIAELATHMRWVGWKPEKRNGKDTKPPFTIGGRAKAKSNDPKTWDGFDQCWTAAFIHGLVHGVGFVLGGGYVGVDLDHCIENGVIAPWALDVVRKINSYTEISPSGAGLHIICRSDLQGVGRKVGNVEIYPRDRYFTVTGDHLPGTPDALSDVPADVLEALLGKANGANGSAGAQATGDVWDRFHEACAFNDGLEALWNGEPPKGEDQSRSAYDLALARRLRRDGFSFEDYVEIAADWQHGTGADGDVRQRRRAWDKAGEDDGSEAAPGQTPDWPEPDVSILSMHQVEAPQLPLEVFGGYWATWISGQAEAKSCPPDYVALAVLAGAGTLIGNACWGAPWDGWVEPPVLWVGNVGNPSSGKSPGLDAVREMLSAIETDANATRKEDLHKWDTAARAAKLHLELWEGDVKVAIKKGVSPPDRPAEADVPERPARRRVITNDPTIEKLARILVDNPKGIVLCRDELSGWVGSLDRYGGSGSDRAFYLEAYGGRSYTVDRVKDAEPISVPALSVGIVGGIQPDRLASQVLAGDDDGLAARFIYTWPERVPPRRPKCRPSGGGKAKLERLFALEEQRDRSGDRLCLRFSEPAAAAIQNWREQVADDEAGVSGLFLSWMGKLAGMAVRIATILEHLFWVGDHENSAQPTMVSERATVAAIALLADYAVPMARRCFGEAALPQVDRDAIALARWIGAQAELPQTLNARALRKATVLSTKDAQRYDAALEELGDAGWIRPAPARAGTSVGRKRKDWMVNPKLRALLS